MLLEDTGLRASLVPDLESMMGRTCSVSGVTDVKGAVAAEAVAYVTASVEGVMVAEVVSVSFTSRGFEVVRGSSRSLEEEDGTLSLRGTVDEGMLLSAGEVEDEVREMFEESLVLVSAAAVSSILYDGNDDLAKEGLMKLAGVVALVYN